MSLFATAGVMARTALEHALPAGWIGEVFDGRRERQHPRELLFSTIVELTTLVSLGLRPSLHAAARTMETLPVTLAALHGKVNRAEPAIEPAILRALARGSAERLAPAAAAVDGGAILPGWRLRVLDGNRLPAGEKRLAPLRERRGAALPGQALVVYGPDSGLVTDPVAGEDARRSGRALAAPLLDGAQPGQPRIPARSRSGLRGTAASARARPCRAGTRRRLASSCASTPAIPGWPGKGNGAGAAEPKPARCANS